MDDSTEDDQKRDRLRAMILSGARIAGGAAGAAIGFFAAGPAGAATLGAAGTMVSDSLAYVGEDVSQRLLGPREKMRVGGILALSAARIEERLKRGDRVRDDGFFDEGVAGRSSADEVAESIITKAQREAEEKKLPFMGNLLANVVFQSDVSPQLAHQLAKLGEALTYRQLCIIGVLPLLKGAPIRQDNYRTQGTFPVPLMGLLYEIYDLLQREIVTNGGSVALGITDINPSQVTVQGLGAHLYNLMELRRIDVADMQEVLDALK